VEAAIQKIHVEITGTATLAQMQAVEIEVRKVGSGQGTSQVVFRGMVEDYLEMNAQMENGTFQVASGATGGMIGNIMLAKDNSVYVGQGDNLIVFMYGLITTMVINLWGLETKAIGKSYSKFSPQNIPGSAPVRRTIVLEDALFIPNDASVIKVQLMYKGRTVEYELAEMQAINRDLRSVIATNYGGAVYAGFVNWLGISLKDVMEVEITPALANVNTTFYLVDDHAVMVKYGRTVVLADKPALVNSVKPDYGVLVQPSQVRMLNSRK